MDRHFSGQQHLIIAAIDLVALGDAVRWERSRHGQLFPHVYAPLAIQVVIGWRALERHVDGMVRLPTATLIDRQTATPRTNGKIAREQCP